MMRAEGIIKAEEIERILFEHSKKTTQGFFWEIARYDKLGNLIFDVDFGLKNGLSGIALFYLELYSATLDIIYLSRFEKTIDVIGDVNKGNLGKHFGFWEGQSGYAYVLLRGYEITGSSKYLEMAKDVMVGCEEFLRSFNANNSLYSGRAGVLMVLMQIYSLTQDKVIGSLAEVALDRLLRNASISKDRLSWYFDQTQTKNPVGWGSGSLGIGYTLAMSSAFYNSPGLKDASNLSINSCLDVWNSSVKNWPDFINKVETPKEDQELLKRFLKNPKLIASGNFRSDAERGWLGMVLGLGLINSAFKNKRLDSQLKKSLAGKREMRVASCTDRHVLLSLARYNKQLTAPLRDTVKGGKKDFDTSKFGLYDGLAGQGLTELFNAGWCGSEYWKIGFANTIKGKADRQSVFMKAPAATILSRIVLPKFYGTSMLLKKRGGANILNMKWPVRFFNVVSLLSPLKRVVERSGDPVLKELFRHESSKLAFISGTKIGEAEIYCEKYLHFCLNRQLQRLSEKALLKKKFMLNPNVLIRNMKWDFLQWNEQLTFTKGNFKFLIIRTDQRERVMEIKLMDFEELLVFMKEPISGEELLGSLVQQYDLNDADKKRNLKSKLVDLILSKVQENILVPARRR